MRSRFILCRRINRTPPRTNTRVPKIIRPVFPKGNKKKKRKKKESPSLTTPFSLFPALFSAPSFIPPSPTTITQPKTIELDFRGLCNEGILRAIKLASKYIDSCFAINGISAGLSGGRLPPFDAFLNNILPFSSQNFRYFCV